MSYYPNNKPCNFTVKTVKLSSLGSNLEVALSEIIFPSGYINVRNGYNNVDMILASDEGAELTNKEIFDMEWTKFTIDPNFYTPTLLIKEINLKIKKKLLEIRVEGDKDRNRIRVKFGLDIAKILGFSVGQWLTFDLEISQNNAGPYINSSLLNVYSDIVEESLIGENHHQLLRMVNWNIAQDNGFDFNPSLIFTRPYFTPVKCTSTNTIGIKITDSLNIPVEFSSSLEPVVVILEFRNGK